MPDTLLSDDDLRTLNDRFEAAHPRDKATSAANDNAAGMTS